MGENRRIRSKGVSFVLVWLFTVGVVALVVSAVVDVVCVCLCVNERERGVGNDFRFLIQAWFRSQICVNGAT